MAAQLIVASTAVAGATGPLSPLMTVAAVLLGVWTVAASAVCLWSLTRLRRVRATERQFARLASLLDNAPALPLMVRPDGRIEGPPRIAQWLGQPSLPPALDRLNTVFEPADFDALSRAVAITQRAAQPFLMTLRPRGGEGMLAFRGQPAEPLYAAPGSAVVWVFDLSQTARQMSALRAEAAQARTDFQALAGLIEAAPIPMWFRSRAGELQLVNTAYVRAVGAQSAEEVIRQGIELVERVDGRLPAEFAGEAAITGRASERIVSATVSGQRRSLRVADLPLGEGGVAGYAFDIQETEDLTRRLRRFADAQRTLLDTLSAGIAQFDVDLTLTFANQPFQRLTGLGPALLLESPPFDRLLERMRDLGRVPEVRDFPEWRREHLAWATSPDTVEEAWVLPDGTHLRVIGQPTPEGGLLLILEDQTERIQLASSRDTLLRTRSATFDNLSESMAVFGPDGRLSQWNRRFTEDWSFEPEMLDRYPRVPELLEQMGKRLLDPAQLGLVEAIVQSATLDREKRRARIALVDGRHLEVSGVPLPDGSGLLTALDVTGSHRAAEALRERNAALVEADEIKTRFIANMSYELRTPLTSIAGFAELLAAGAAGELSERGAEYVDAILVSVERLTSQIETVLDLSQSEAGTLPLARELVDIYNLVLTTAEARSRTLEEHRLTIDFRGDPKIGTLMGDSTRLARAFGHLIDLAIGATPPEGRVAIELKRNVRDSLTVTISCRPPRGHTAELPSLADSNHPGLALARQMIEAHGGLLTVQEGRAQPPRITVTLS